MPSKQTLASVVALLATTQVTVTAEEVPTVIVSKQSAPFASCMAAEVPLTEYTLEEAKRCKGFTDDNACATTSCCTTAGEADVTDEDRNCATARDAGGELQYEQINTKDDLYHFEAWGGQKNCAVTGMKPREPRSLSFCHKFNENACCAPVMDDENTAMFNMLTGVGLSCRIRGDIREDPLAQWYCMNCDPEQPSYLRDAPHDPISPDCNGGSEGKGGGDDDGACGSSPGSGRDQTLLICEDWAEASFGKDPILEGPNGRFDLCGLLKSSPCLDGAGETIPDRDPYTCGDDLVIPSSYIVTNADGSVNSRLSLESFMNVDSMGPPLLMEDFYFKIVPRANADGTLGLWCDEADLEKEYLALDTAASARPQPMCLRSKAQMVETKYKFGTDAQYQDVTYQQYYCSTSDAGEDCAALDCKEAAVHMANPCCCAPWIDEKCFDSAMGLSPLSVVSMLLASVAAFIVF